MSTQFNDTLGAILLGGIVSSVLYGVTCLQSFTFFRQSTDSRRFRTSIAFLWIFDTVQQAFVIHALYFYLVLNFTNSAVLTDVVWSSLAQILAATASDTLVRGVFATRIWGLSRSILLVAIIGFFSLTYLGMVSGFTILMLAGSQKAQHTMWLFYVSLGAAVTADVCIAIFLCWHLYRKKLSFKSTESIVKMIIGFTINTGLVMTLASTSVFISFVLQPDNFIYIGIFFITTKLYNNSLLASLNFRDYVRTQANSVKMLQTANGVPPFNLSTTGSNASINDQSNTLDLDNINFKTSSSNLVP